MTKIDYKLLKELKEAGFPQGKSLFSHVCDSRTGNHSDGEYFCPSCVHRPTSDEVMDALTAKMMYFGLEKHSNDWRAGGLKPGGISSFVSGKTPLEALIRLYIAVNKK